MAAIAVPEQHPLADRIIDIAAVVLISLAAVATAWCGYQSARWSALQALKYNQANAARVASSIASARANTALMIDAALFVQYESALFSSRNGFADFIKRRFRPEFRTALNAWLKTRPHTNPRAPLTPFAMREYHPKALADAANFSQQADRLVAEAILANKTSDDFVFVTVLFALTSFMGGLSVKARYPISVVLLAVGTIVFAAAAITVVTYPVR